MREMRLITADWVVPVAGDPIEYGAVLVERGRVTAVDTAAALRATAPEAESEQFLGSVILPGLVNAHTHLSLTALKGAAPPGEFTEWLDTVVPRIKELGPEALAASAANGVRQMLSSGVTAVGDVTYRDESVGPAAQAGLAGVFFREVMGRPGDEVAGFLEESGFPLDAGGPSCGPPARIVVALSAHAPYSTGPAAIRETARIAREQGLPLMMHVAESPAEDDLLRRGEGRFVSLAARMAPDFESPGVGTVTYLDELGVLEGVVAVHAVQADESEITLLAEKARGIVLCPRSNLYLDCGSPPVRAFVDAGATLAIGTDSIASNRDFDLFEEARALREIDPTLPATRLLEMMTSEGARVLGLPGHGTLAPGGPADLTVIALGPTDDPVRDVIGTTRRRDVQATMAAGAWRFRKERR